ncbi:MAG: adenylate/guanylate cyclase domain-containing protein [Betaproteobacteria bacterium]|nr:MAG: adenylate/guanylate cyclase domain-containing protein [Betaproteobacteria bacterium]
MAGWRFRLRASPLGVTTLLFTDIEGSTRLWEADGERMSLALREHDALSRTAVESHGGVIVKMTGDGMYAAFSDALNALNATVLLQLSLAELAANNHLPLQVRAGLHLGVVERRDDDLFGSAVNRAARIMKAAHGGQVLLSRAVAEHLRERLPPSIELRDLGAVRLRDLATSEHVYQLVHPGLRQDFPALRSLEATPNNLPQQVTSFVGRERELADAKRLLQGTRLLTLLGMGGLGKTRLSLQIAADMLEKYPDGVWFVDLAPLKDSSLVPNAAAQVLGIHEEHGRSVTETLCTHIKDHKLLLVLDNCEHLIGACAMLAEALLQGAPELRLMATSREALRIRGEQTYTVLPLAVPDRKADAESILRSEAVQLFVERARLQKPDFAVTEAYAPQVAELCARLEGIPLALELAAARLRSLSISDLNARLHDRFKLLTGGSRVALERQQTLHALVNWSYDLLNDNERIVLERLSVFAAGFDLEAAEAVCGADPIVRENVLDLVTSLVEKSLVMVEQEGDGSRYGLLETIREFAYERLTKRYGILETIRDFARERLTDRGDVAATAARHCNYYLGIAKTARGKLEGPEQAAWMRRLEVDLDNLRASIALALAGGVDPVIAIKFEVALMRFWMLRGYSTEARDTIRAALALPALQELTVARAHALYVGGVLATNQSDHAEAATMLEECLEIRRGLGKPPETAGTLSTLATLYLQQDDVAKARACEEEAIGIFRELGDKIGEAIGLANLGEIAVRQGDDRNAQELFEQCLALSRRIKHLELESECERNLGELALRAGQVQQGQARFAHSLKVCREAEDKRGEAISLWRLGNADAAAGDLELGRSRVAEALRTFRLFRMNAEVLDCLEDHAEILHRSGRTHDAVRQQAAAAAVRETLALARPPRTEARRRKVIEEARTTLGEAAFAHAWSAGRAWGLDDAIDHVLASSVAPVAA